MECAEKEMLRQDAWVMESESETTSQKESIFIMEVMDRVREIDDLRYLERVESILLLVGCYSY